MTATGAAMVIGLGLWSDARFNSSRTGSLQPAVLALSTSTPLAATPLADGVPDEHSASLAAVEVATQVSLPASMPPWTPTPTAMPTSTPPPTPFPTRSIAPAQPSALLSGVRHEWQTWNNCGPATLAMNLSYYGSLLDQGAIGAVLRTSPDDKNVSPHELVDFARGQGYAAELYVNGSADLLKTLISNGFPVLLETWHERAPGDGIGHYRLAVGYDDATGQWTLYDSLDYTGLISLQPYAGIRMGYDRLDRFWKVFNRTFLLVHPVEQTPQVQAVLAAHGFDPAQMWRHAEARARAELEMDPADVFAWFNLGSSLTHQGRTAEAVVAFERAREIGLPERMLWYQFTPLEAYVAEGRPLDVLALTDAIFEETESVEELFYWRARAFLLLGDVAAAQEALTRSLELAPTFAPALALQQELSALNPLEHEERELRKES
ncbi:MULTISPECIES: C39 family peptidase [Caldilinea]|jgi:tetratricopeptide (TPR) repeat protein|nr:MULTISPECIES: C39 family peptidase [Caldilinea]MBO9393832.1 C39 family peptidase [Caldilinea sp.]